MLDYQKRAKLNKILLITVAILIVVAIIVGIILLTSNKKDENVVVNYKDTIVGNNYYSTITIDTITKKVQRDNRDTSLQQEFGITDEKASNLLSSTTELMNYFENSTIEVQLTDGIITLKNPFQTKTLFAVTNQITDSFNAEEIQIQDGLYMLRYDSQKRTKAAYEFLKNQEGIDKVIIDEVIIIDPIKDESQTVYGEINKKDATKTHGISAMGIQNYKNIINGNGNTSEIVVATVGYGAAINNKYFENKISQDYYSFIDDSKDVHENPNVPQGSRILEVIKEATTDNVKILPLVVVNDEQYTTTSSIVQALAYASEQADVICYEIVHKKDEIIELVLKNAFKQNVPVCCVTKSAQEGEEIYPASDGTTIAVSSVDKSLKTMNYSAIGEYIDFVASSTDVEEIFNTNSRVSKWSGAEYSNAHIVSIIALIKSYNKDITIFDLYNTIRSKCKDLGNKGKDIYFGHGIPDFSDYRIADIDKEKPKIDQIVVDNEKWEKSKNIQINAKDNIRIYGWNVTNIKEVPKEWNKLEKISNTLSTQRELNKNGTYYIWVTDSAGNVELSTIEVTKIDNAPPTIQYGIDDSRLAIEKVITITVNATDNESGLNAIPYSWDKQNWGMDNRTLRITENGSYTIYVRDALENIAEKKISINSIPEEGVADIDNGDLIKDIKVSADWQGDKNNEVIITFNDNLNVEYWKIVDTEETPSEFVPTDYQNEQERVEDENNTGAGASVDQNSNSNSSTIVNNNNSQGRTNMTITVKAEANKKYYLWIKNTNGSINSQGFTIRKPE